MARLLFWMPYSLSLATLTRPLQSLFMLNIEETYSLFLQTWLKWGRDSERKEVERKGRWEQTSADLGLFPTAALPPPPCPSSLSCLFNAVLTQLSNGQFSATSFHFTSLPPLKVSYSIHFNIPGKLKVLLQTHAFHMCLEAFVTISGQTCPFIVSCFIWPAMFNRLPMNPSTYFKMKGRQAAISGLALMLLMAWPADHIFSLGLWLFSGCCGINLGCQVTAIITVCSRLSGALSIWNGAKENQKWLDRLKHSTHAWGPRFQLFPGLLQFNSAAAPLAPFMSPDIKNANQMCHSLVENWAALEPHSSITY